MVSAESLAELSLGWGAGMRSVVVLLVAYVAARFVHFVLTKASARSVERRITFKMLIPVLKVGIYGVAVVYILGSILNLTSTQLLAVSGLIGAGLGFGLKDLFANVIGGLVMIFERPYRVGDKIQVGDHYGEVLDIGIRSTTIVTPDDTEVSIPNYRSFTESIANANAGSPEMMVVVPFAIHRDADVRRAEEIVEKALVTSPYTYVAEDRPYTVLVEDETHHVTVKGKAYVNDHRNEFAFKSDVTERVLERFEEEGIEKPRFPALD
ncbi:MAG: mechanosensitive ion channel family protein [Candidatus Nanohaloarchaea archaeon]|nr:mechanosensitive ion channel family protein [Candidatus Nanohaloarchaea archaeon]